MCVRVCVRVCGEKDAVQGKGRAVLACRGLREEDIITDRGRAWRYTKKAGVDCVAKGREQRAEDRGQRAEGRGKRAAGRGQMGTG